MFLKSRWHVPVQNLVKYPPPPELSITARLPRLVIKFNAFSYKVCKQLELLVEADTFKVICPSVTDSRFSDN